MLGEGVSAALQFLGIEHRTVCYVEREAAAASQLATLMEAGALDPAPIWSDMLTFDGGAWRGKVDCVVAGFPCQDLSVAGRRAGLDGKRSGLFFRVIDIADDCGATKLILENVSGIASATASVMDEAEGELDERAAARVVGELADRGWHAEWITISASDVGASHGRARWFCFAWRMADTGLQHQHVQQRQDGAESEREGGKMDHTPGGNGSRDGRGSEAQKPFNSVSGADMGDTECARWPQTGSGSEKHPGRKSEPGRSAMADPGGQRHEGRQQRRTRSGNRGGQETHGPISELCRAFPIFAPGPEDHRWADILEQRPDLAPATEPGVRLLVDGMALLVDESRSHQLRQVGNGVVPLCAAVALVILFRRAAERVKI